MIPKPRKSLDSLATLNRKSRELAFGLEDIDWFVPVDRAKPWMPDGIGTLYFLPSYQLLEAEEKLRYNQLHALGIVEQFIWLEQEVVITPVRFLARKRELPQELREALWHFAEEENKHIAMFWRLLEKSEPKWYPQHRPRLFKVTPLQQFLMTRITERPELLLVWIWITIFVEERTIFLSREYMNACRKAPGIVDALHTMVHEFHFRDEARHYQLDQHLLTWIYDVQSAWKRRLCGWMFAQVVRSYVFPHRTARRILAVMEREFPRLRQSIAPQLRAELPGIGFNIEFHRKLLSRRALPRTLALLAGYPEHDRLWELFITEHKHPA